MSDEVEIAKTSSRPGADDRSNARTPTAVVNARRLGRRGAELVYLLGSRDLGPTVRYRAVSDGRSEAPFGRVQAVVEPTHLPRVLERLARVGMFDAGDESMIDLADRLFPVVHLLNGVPKRFGIIPVNSSLRIEILGDRVPRFQNLLGGYHRTEWMRIIDLAADALIKQKERTRLAVEGSAPTRPETKGWAPDISPRQARRRTRDLHKDAREPWARDLAAGLRIDSTVANLIEELNASAISPQPGELSARQRDALLRLLDQPFDHVPQDVVAVVRHHLPGIAHELVREDTTALTEVDDATPAPDPVILDAVVLDDVEGILDHDGLDDFTSCDVNSIDPAIEQPLRELPHGDLDQPLVESKSPDYTSTMPEPIDIGQELDTLARRVDEREQLVIRHHSRMSPEDVSDVVGQLCDAIDEFVEPTSTTTRGPDTTAPARGSLPQAPSSVTEAISGELARMLPPIDGTTIKLSGFDFR